MNFKTLLYCLVFMMGIQQLSAQVVGTPYIVPSENDCTTPSFSISGSNNVATNQTANLSISNASPSNNTYVWSIVQGSGFFVNGVNTGNSVQVRSNTAGRVVVEVTATSSEPEPCTATTFSRRHNIDFRTPQRVTICSSDATLFGNTLNLTNYTDVVVTFSPQNCPFTSGAGTHCGTRIYANNQQIGVVTPGQCRGGTYTMPNGGNLSFSYTQTGYNFDGHGCDNYSPGVFWSGCQLRYDDSRILGEGGSGNEGRITITGIPR